MSQLTSVSKLENLQRAWAWLRSNPDHFYKAHFRELYSAYATADTALLKQLKNRLDREIFEPSDACKLLLPKPSGILRPISLLTIEDQIVYQSMTNIVAEKLWPHVHRRYNKQVFGHQYAGSSSIWFYRKWIDGYKAFNAASIKAFSDGYIWTASFDLTAFYDSIDHNVLRYMLRGIGCDEDFCVQLTKLLNKWTATSTQIYHDHGIPQGPLSSGLISEAVLKHFDENFVTQNDVRYFRYVDDIRLFAKSERHLRHALVALDRLSKDVGLFPQSGKIDIHKILDMKYELKSVSLPTDYSGDKTFLNQKDIQKNIADLAPRTSGYEVSNPTRFKYLLSKSDPTLRTLNLIWRVFERQPHFYPQLSSYLQKFDSLPDLHADRLLKEIETQDLYPAIRASLITAADNRFSASRSKKLRQLLKPMWKPRSSAYELSDTLWRALHRLNHMTDRQSEYALLNIKPSWLRMRLQFGMPWFNEQPARRDRILNLGIKDNSADVAISSAWILALLDGQVIAPLTEIHPTAKLILREAGKIRRAQSGICGIRMSMSEMIGEDILINWRKLLGSKYKQAEAKIVACKGYYKTNPTAWVNMLDVFNDLFVDELFKKDGAIGLRNLGNFGGVIGNNSFTLKYPRVHAYIKILHEKRLESELSHAIVKTTKAPTSRVPFSWLKIGRKSLKKAIEELRSAGF